MMPRLEDSINDFLDKWLVRTLQHKDFVPVEELWRAAQKAAGSEDIESVWGYARRPFLDYARARLGLRHQVTRYYKLEGAARQGLSQGVPVAAYEGVKMSEYGLKHLNEVVLVRPRRRKRRNPHAIANL